VDAIERFDENVVLLDTGFQNEFRQPMDRAATEAAFRVTDRGDAYYEMYGDVWPEVEGQIRWDAQRVNPDLPTGDATQSQEFVLRWIGYKRSQRCGGRRTRQTYRAIFVTVSLPQAYRSYPPSHETIRPG
jgi:hypothetical protein